VALLALKGSLFAFGRTLLVSLLGQPATMTSAMRSQTALSLGVIALSDCCRHSSALSRNSSAVPHGGIMVARPSIHRR
jgi:hypothetical protein